MKHDDMSHKKKNCNDNIKSFFLFLAIKLLKTELSQTCSTIFYKLIKIIN